MLCGGDTVVVDILNLPPLAAAILPKSTTTVLPYPVTLSPVPTKLISVKPTTILSISCITPVLVFIYVDPIPTPDVYNCPS